MDLNILKTAASNYPNDIRRPFDIIYNQLGFDGLALFLDIFGQRSVYIPNLRTVLADCIVREAVTNHKNCNLPIHAKAKKYGYSCRQYRYILQKK